MTREFHKFWLKISAVAIAAFGPVFTLGAWPPTSTPARFAIDILRFFPDPPTAWDAPEARLVSAVIGGVLIGWGVMIWSLSGAAYDAAPEAVRRAVVTGSLAWFLVDSAGSLLAGAPGNVLLNAVVLMIIIGPLWRPANPTR